MKHIKPLIILTCIATILMMACKKNEMGPIKNDGTAPGPVSNVTSKGLPGAAEITYTLPADKDILYVKAVYKTKNGIVRESKSSYYNNTITVVGFADATPQTVELYTVDEGENMSAPVKVTVTPLKPPYLLARESLLVIPDFGGINTSFTNPAEDNIAIIVMKMDANGDFVTYDTHYTDLRQSNYSVRGFDSIPSKFGIYVRDRWGNLSDTFVTTVKPLFEARLDRTKMKGIALPSDASLGFNGQINFLFDANLTDNGYYHTGDGSMMPSWFTYDMGVTAKISRLVWWQRQRTGDQWFYYNLHNPRNVEIWGSNNPPSDGSWNNWILLATHEQIKPSGLPVGELTQADRDAAEAGETIKFPLDTPPVRYIRFKTTRNWSDGNYVNFNEIAMWGQPQ